MACNGNENKGNLWLFPCIHLFTCAFRTLRWCSPFSHLLISCSFFFSAFPTFLSLSTTSSNSLSTTSSNSCSFLLCFLQIGYITWLHNFSQYITRDGKMGLAPPLLQWWDRMGWVGPSQHYSRLSPSCQL